MSALAAKKKYPYGINPFANYEKTLPPSLMGIGKLFLLFQGNNVRKKLVQRVTRLNMCGLIQLRNVSSVRLHMKEEENRELLRCEIVTADC